MIVTILAVIAAIFLIAYAVGKRLKSVNNISERDLRMRIIDRANRMFPETPYLHERLDKLFQPYYREYLDAKSKGNINAQRNLLSGLTIIHNTKLEALQDTIEFESKIIKQLIHPVR